MTQNSEQFCVASQEIHERLDKLLTARLPDYSRTYFQYLIEQGCVLVNGLPCKKREKLKEGDEIEICFALTPEISFEPENIPLDILYEDDHLLAVNKPPGLVVHPAAGHFSGTFLNALLHHCKQLRVTEDNLRPGIVHRLDKDTSGVLLAAKTTEAHQKLVSLFCSRKVEKHYLAVCVGNPGNVTIDAPLKRHPVRRKEMAVCEAGEGKQAVSKCTVKAITETLTLVDIELITGRTHQIRAHLRHKCCPILGDPIYGAISANDRHGIKRQLLHAESVKFEHPFTGKWLELKAPIPSDMSDFIRKKFT
jgi:23S rRNA pseudouridine1911/1915/1917 synthase